MQNAKQKSDQEIRIPFKFYVHELRSDECCCGRSKKKGRSFCWHCWQLLPHHIQQGLYQPLFGGYEESYEEAVRHLEDAS